MSAPEVKLGDSQPLPALWQRLVGTLQANQVTAPAAPPAGDAHQALRFYLDIELAALKVAREITGPQPPLAPLFLVAGSVSRHLRARLGLPVDPAS